MKKQRIFILGGARSGKSRFACELAAKLSKNVLFVATGIAFDKEMKTRIALHKSERPKTWKTLEVINGVGDIVIKSKCDAQVIVLDCLSMLINNIFFIAGHKKRNCLDQKTVKEIVDCEVEKLLSCFDKTNAHVIIVSNEVGLGIVPKNKLARFYRDCLGWANQRVAQYANKVYWMAAGIAVKIKSP